MALSSDTRDGLATEWRLDCLDELLIGAFRVGRVQLADADAREAWMTGVCDVIAGGAATERAGHIRTVAEYLQYIDGELFGASREILVYQFWLGAKVAELRNAAGH